MSTERVKKIILKPKQVWDPNDAGFTHPQPFSQGVIAPAGRMVWAAGQVALDREGAVVGKGDAARQTAAALENLKAVLEDAGATMEDVVKLTVYLTHMSRDLAQVQEMRRKYFPVDPPASSTIGISELVNPELLVEIEALAVIDATP